MRQLLFLVVIFLILGCEEATDQGFYYWEGQIYDPPAGVPREVQAVKVGAKTLSELDRQRFEGVEGWDWNSMRNFDFNRDGGKDFFIRNYKTGEEVYLYSNMPSPKPRRK